MLNRPGNLLPCRKRGVKFDDFREKWRRESRELEIFELRNVEKFSHTADTGGGAVGFSLAGVSGNVRSSDFDSGKECGIEIGFIGPDVDQSAGDFSGSSRPAMAASLR